MFFFDPLYFVILAPALILSVWAQFKVKGAVKKWSAVANTSGMTGAQAARRILDYSGLYDVRVEGSQGHLSDHYDPGDKVLRLSPDIYGRNSVAAVGIAAHEAGHALQHANNYAPLKLRSAIVPTARFGSWLSFPLIIGGFMLMFFGMPTLGHWAALAGVVFFGATVVFQLVTLPVEFDASSRAKKVVADLGIIQHQEEALGVNKVLSAAAMTYVAAAVSALLTLLYYALRLGLLASGDE